MWGEGGGDGRGVVVSTEKGMLDIACNMSICIMMTCVNRLLVNKMCHNMLFVLRGCVCCTCARRIAGNCSVHEIRRALVLMQ